MLLLCSCTAVFAQPVLTAANVSPQIGNQMYYFNVGRYPEGDSGAGRIWDFSTVKSTNSSSAKVIPCNASVVCGNFPGSNVASSFTNAEYFLSATSDSIELLGSWNYPYVQPQEAYTNPRMVMRFPFTYGDRYVDSFSSIVRSGHSVIVLVGSDSTEADGWGTLKIKYWSLPNVLRIRKIATVLGTVTDTITNVVRTYQNKEVSYFWYTPGYHDYLLTMSTLVSMFNGTTSSSLTGAYTGSSAGYPSAVAEVQTIAGIIENPARDVLRISTTSPVALQYTIIDALGSVVRAGNLPGGTREHKISLSAIPTGLYCLLLNDGKSRSVERFTVQ